LNRGRWLFIVNPVAGGGRAVKQLAHLETLLRRFGLDYRVMLTNNPGHAVTLAADRLLQGFEKICVVGGDGTLHEVVNGIMRTGRQQRVRLGILPLGGGNDYARTLGIPADWEQALDLYINGRVTMVDVGRVEKTWFINALGIGLDARVAWHAQHIHKLNGLPRYLLAVVRSLAEHPSVSVDVRLDDDLFRGRYLLLSIGLGRFCGGGFQLNPHADTHDGLFDLCFVDAMSTAKTMTLLPLGISGKHITRREVRCTRSKLVEVRSRTPLPVYMDGELPVLRDPCRLRIELLPAQIGVVGAS